MSLLALYKPKAFTLLLVSMKIAFGQLEYTSIIDGDFEVVFIVFVLEVTDYQ